MSLHYSFPRSESRKPASPEMSRESHISKKLEFQNSPSVPTSQISREPYVKSFTCSNPNTPESLIISSIDDPIDDIFQESHRQIFSYKMELPGAGARSSSSRNINASPKKIDASPMKNNSSPMKIDAITNMDPLFNASQMKIDASPMKIDASPMKIDASPMKIDASPLRNSKSIDVGGIPANSKKNVQSTPVRNTDPKTPVPKEPSRKLSFSEDSFLDPLACHADNIMRMAMDSTLAHSFSSNFSNLVDDTHHEKSRRFPGFNERTIVEISAADLENAVNDPFRL